MLRYLGRYTNRVAISLYRLIGFDDERVAARGIDYAHGGNERLMILRSQDFMRRFSCTCCPRTS